MLGLTKIFFRIFHFGMRIGAMIVPFPVPKVLQGQGAVTALPAEMSRFGVTHALVVTGNNVRKMARFADMLHALEQQNIRYTVFSNLQPNPTLQNVEDARQAYLDAGCNGIIAFGGGSPIDCAKLAGARLTNGRSVRQMAGLFRVFRRIPPLFAIPTTAGTGSEVTIAAVVTDPENRSKFSVSDPKLVPKIAVLDPTVMAGLPPSITGATGMDALTHAIEAYVGLSGTPSTDRFAEKAVPLIIRHLEHTYANGSDMQAREQMALASYYAGAAFTKASVGYVHAISHKLGALYGVAHGLANAIILPHVLDFYGESAHRKLARLAVLAELGSAEDADAVLAAKMIAKIRQMNANMQIPEVVADMKREDIPEIADSALREAHPMYPVPRLMSRRDCEIFLERLLDA